MIGYNQPSSFRAKRSGDPESMLNLRRSLNKAIEHGLRVVARNDNRWVKSWDVICSRQCAAGFTITKTGSSFRTPLIFVCDEVWGRC